MTDMLQGKSESETQESFAHVKKSKRKKRLKILLAAFGILLVFFVVSVEVTSSSKFCSVCHYMKPFFQSWESSSHKQVQCKVCHYPPGLRSTLRAKMEGLIMVGRYWTKLYLKSKPWAEIQDESCLQKGCHDKRILEGQVSFKKVAFDHKVHFSDLKRGKQLRCTSCHSQIVQGEHITVTESSCFICHFKKSEHYPQISDCSHCHKKDQLISEKTSRYNHVSVFANGFNCDKCHSQVVMGDGIVPRENCYKCHFEKERLDRYEDTDLMHKMHISSHKIECDQCHIEIQHKIAKDREAITDCRTCHTGSHQAQKILFFGEGGKGIDHPVPNVMLEKGLSCKGCHMFHEESGGTLIRSETSVSRDKACESCHGRGFARILKDWETSTQNKLRAINAIFQRALQEVRQAGADVQKKSEGFLEEAAFNIDVVDKGKGVHNMAYAQDLLQASLDKIEEALKLAGSAYKPDRTSVEAQKIPNSCLTCHAGIEEITSPVFGLTFPHKSHIVLQSLDCTKCHSNVKTHGEFIGTKSSCATCHHKDAKKDCVDCHKLQKTLYMGGAIGEVNIPRDIMAEAEADCAACHTGLQNQVVRPTATPCVACHDKAYEKTFEEWRASTKKLLEETHEALRAVERTSLTEDEKIQTAKIEMLLKAFEEDGSLGIHNHAFVEESLTEVLKNIRSLTKRDTHEQTKIH